MAEEEKKSENNESSSADNQTDQKSNSKAGSDEPKDSQKEQQPDKGSSGDSREEQSGEEEGQKEITIFEWIAAALGCFLVVGSMSFMTYKAITAGDKAPELKTQVKSIEKLENGYLVKFEVKNDGEYTAAAAIIKGELKKGGKTEETSTTSIDYVPSYSTRSGGIYFSKDPRESELTLRATGYTEP